MEPDEKVRENRLRRAARRQGMELVKSRTRDPRGVDYGCYGLSRDGEWVAGVSNHLSMSLDDVEAYLTTPTGENRMQLPRIDQNADVEVTLTRAGDGQGLETRTWTRPVDDETGAGAIDVLDALSGAIDSWTTGSAQPGNELKAGDTITIKISE